MWRVWYVCDLILNNTWHIKWCGVRARVFMIFFNLYKMMCMYILVSRCLHMCWTHSNLLYIMICIDVEVSYKIKQMVSGYDNIQLYPGCLGVYVCVELIVICCTLWSVWILKFHIKPSKWFLGMITISSIWHIITNFVIKFNDAHKQILEDTCFPYYMHYKG